jgi:hypothetical protein
MYHPILDWRLAADTLELLIDGHPTPDRWVGVRDAAMRGIQNELGWSVIGVRITLMPCVRPATDTGSGPQRPVAKRLQLVVQTGANPGHVRFRDPQPERLDH